MFRLYGNIAGWRALDEKEKEKDIIETMIDYSNDTGIYDYFITKVRGERNTSYKEAPYKRIIGKKQFANYLEKYKERIELENMPCVELKRYILNRKGI